MKAAHIVVVLNETDTDTPPVIHFSCSGGDELVREDSKRTFDYIKEEIVRMFGKAQEDWAEENCLE